MREGKLTIVVVAALMLCLLVYLVAFTVRVDQVAVHKRGGRVIRVIQPSLHVGEQSEPPPSAREGHYEYDTTAGLKWKLPWPFEEVKYYSQRVRTVDAPLTQTQLQDGNQIIPRVYATWRIVDPVVFERTLGEIPKAEQTLKTVIGNETAEIVGAYRLSDIVNVDAAKLKFPEIESRIYEDVRAKMGAEYGIDVTSLGITWVALPESVTVAVFERMRKERESAAMKLRAEGEMLKRKRIAEANQQRDQIIAKAQAEAKEIMGRAEAEAAAYYDTFAKNESLAVFLRGLAAIRRIASDAQQSGRPMTLILSTKTPPFSLLEKGPGAIEEGALAPPELPAVVPGDGAAGALVGPAGAAALSSDEEE